MKFLWTDLELVGLPHFDHDAEQYIYCQETEQIVGLIRRQKKGGQWASVPYDCLVVKGDGGAGKSISRSGYFMTQHAAMVYLESLAIQNYKGL